MKKTHFYDNWSSVVFMWIAFGLAFLAILMMFCPAINIDGVVRSSALLFFQKEDGYAAGWPIFAGYMAMTVAAVMVAVLALPFIKPSIKAEKIVLITAIILLLFGSCTSFFSTIIYLCMTGRAHMINMYNIYAGPFLAGSFSLLAAVSSFVALKLDL